MELITSSVKPMQNEQILFNKAQTLLKRNEFSDKLALFEKGQLTSANQRLDIALYKNIIPHRDMNGGNIPWDLYQLCYERSSLVYNAINNTADFSIQAGFDFNGSSDAKKKIEDWFDEVNFELILRNIFIQLQVYGNAYLDVSNMKFPKLLPVKTMFVVVEKGGGDDGKILGYKQILETPNDVIEFTQEQIIHFKNNDACNYFYGMSEIKPVLGSLTRYANWTEDLGQILHRFASPYLHHKIGTPEKPATKPQLDDYTDTVENRLPGEDIITSSAVEIEVIQATKGMIQVDNLVKNLQDEIIAGLRIPEIFARGGITSNKAVGDVEMQAFDRKCKALQYIVGMMLEDFLFPKITSRISRIKMVWNEFSAEGEKVRAERLKLMIESGIPLIVALQMIGWGTWLEEVKTETEKQEVQLANKEDAIQSFKPEEKPQEEMALKIVNFQKTEYREPIVVTIPIETSLSSQKDMFRNPLKR